MKKNNLDNFFYTKLSGKETPPTNQAWLKLEEKLSYKRKRILFYRYAAAISFLLISCWGLWIFNLDYFSSDDYSTLIQENPDRKIKQEIKPKKESEKETLVLVPEQEAGNLIVANEPSDKEKEVSSKVPEKAKVNSKENLIVVQEEKAKLAPEPEDFKGHDFARIEDEILEEFKEIPLDNKAEINTFPKVTITFVRGSSTIAKEVAMETSTKVSPDQESKFKKLLQSARDIKLSEVNLAEIRETKNELFNLKPKL